MKKNKNKKITFSLLEVIVIVLATSLIMCISTGFIVYRNNNIGNLTNNENLKEFISSYHSILNNYYDNIDESQLVDAAIKGMVDYLGDPYTNYLNENNTDSLISSLNGTYEGIGISVLENENKEIVVMEVYDNTPAQKAGIKAQDIIIKVDNVDVKDKEANEVVNSIKNSKNKEVNITVLRDNSEIDFNLVRQTLYVPAIKSELIEKNDSKIGYIYIEKFSNTIYEQFYNELTKLENNNINSLIIDVRGNTGGYLKGATSIASLFLKEGKTIFSLENKITKEVTKDETEDYREYKVAVLINEGSASASEVLAAALKYSYGATLVGKKSYGKGKVQQTSDLTDGAMIKYTTAKWLTPNGDCIDGIGLNPDIEVDILDEETTEYSIDTDQQIQSAINSLTS